MVLCETFTTFWAVARACILLIANELITNTGIMRSLHLLYPAATPNIHVSKTQPQLPKFTLDS
jgi:hypothetical protein